MADDSSNFLKTLADPHSWGVDQSFDHTPTSVTTSEAPAMNDDGLPPIVSGDQFPKQYDLPRRSPLIQNFCRKGEVVSLTAASKMGKSWFLQNAATCLAEGIPFLGLEVAKTNVLMLDLELAQADAQDRLWSIALGMGLKAPPRDLYLWSLRKHCYDLNVITETLHARLKDMPDVGAVFLDPVYMLGQSQDFDENSSSSVTSLMTELEKITAKNGAALFVSHHFRKGKMGGESHIDRGSGSGVFARFPDCLITLSSHQVQEHAILEMTSRSQKSPQPFVLKMTPPVIEVAENADPTAFRRFDRPNSEPMSDDGILDLVPVGQSLTKAAWMAKAKMQGVGQQQFDEHFNSLCGSGRVKPAEIDGVVAYGRTIQ